MIFNSKNNANKLIILYNKESNMEIAKVEIANSFLSRLIGLMFKKNTEYPLLFEIPNKIKSRYRSSIHSFFMRFDLILVFIDEDNIIYEIADLKPWHCYTPKKPAQYIIEFGKNDFNNYDLKIGDKIKLKKN